MPNRKRVPVYKDPNQEPHWSTDLTTNGFLVADARTEEQNNAAAADATATATAEAAQAVYPRYDVPFDRENIKDFFTFRRGVVENAIQECITALLFPEDGEYLGAWLLTELVKLPGLNKAIHI